MIWPGQVCHQQNRYALNILGMGVCQCICVYTCLQQLIVRFNCHPKRSHLLHIRTYDMHVCVCVCIYIDIDIYKQRHTYMCACTHKHIHKYIYIYIYIHVSTHTCSVIGRLNLTTRCCRSAALEAADMLILMSCFALACTMHLCVRVIMHVGLFGIGLATFV